MEKNNCKIFNLTRIQIGIVKTLRGFNKYNIRKIGKYLDVTHSTISKNVIRLNELGLIKKEMSGRECIVTLTDKYKNAEIID